MPESVLTIGGKKTKIALRRCTPRDTFSEKFSALIGSSKKSRMSGFPCGELQGRIIYGHVSDFLSCFEDITSHYCRISSRFVRGSRDISLAPSLHRASANALIYTPSVVD